MEVRGRNGKWFGTGNRRTVGKVGLVVVFKFCPRVWQGRGGNNALVIVDIIECCTGISQHECVGGKHRGRRRRRSINGKERADSGELVVDFLFLDVEKMSDVLNHLFVGESHLLTGRAIRRRGGDDVRSIADTVGRGRRTGRDEDGGRGTRHRWDGWAVVWCVESKEVVCIVNTKGAVDWWRCCEVLESQSEEGMRII